MAYGTRPPVAISHATRWLAVLRIAVGLYFAKTVVTKMTIVLAGGFLPVPAVQDRWIGVMPKIVSKQASENPILFYKQFLEDTVLIHSNLFAHLTAWGETVAGLGLVLGLCTGIASLVGFVLVVNYSLATQWMSAGQQGFHMLLVVLMVAFFFSRSGRTWGLDGWIARVHPRSILSRRPFS